MCPTLHSYCKETKLKGAFSGLRQLLAPRSPSKMMKRVFLFYLKSHFRSQDIWFFFLIFWSCRKTALLERPRLISKFMTSQLGYRTITIQVLPNISRSKDNQRMKFDQLIEYNTRNIFLQKSCMTKKSRQKFKYLENEKSF